MRTATWFVAALLFALGCAMVVQQVRVDRMSRVVRDIETEIRRLRMSASRTINGTTYTWTQGAGDWPDGTRVQADESGTVFLERVGAWVTHLGGN